MDWSSGDISIHWPRIPKTIYTCRRTGVQLSKIAITFLDCATKLLEQATDSIVLGLESESGRGVWVRCATRNAEDLCGVVRIARPFSAMKDDWETWQNFLDVPRYFEAPWVTGLHKMLGDIRIFYQRAIVLLSTFLISCISWKIHILIRYACAMLKNSYQWVVAVSVPHKTQ